MGHSPYSTHLREARMGPFPSFYPSSGRLEWALFSPFTPQKAVLNKRVENHKSSLFPTKSVKPLFLTFFHFLSKPPGIAPGISLLGRNNREYPGITWDYSCKTPLKQA